MIFIVLLWLVLIVVGIKYNKTASETAFTLDNSAALRGICAIEIMMGHLGIATGSMVLYPNRKAGILFVGVFFALSGYGLMYSVINKNDYMVNFIFKKAGKLLIPVYIVFVINNVLDNVIEKNSLDFREFVNIKNIFLMTNWYVWELLMLYIVFHICFKTSRNAKIIFLVILCFSIIFVIAAYVFKLENPWYGSTLCFGFGMFYYLHREQFKEIFVLRNPIIKMAGCCLIMIASICLFFVRGGVIGLLVSRNVASVTFVVLLLCCLHRFSIGNSVSVWLGKCSYEIFLFHPLFIRILRPWIKNDVIYSFLVIGITILVSYLYILCESRIKLMCKKYL